MSKKAKIFTTLLSCACLLLLYIVVTSEEVDMKTGRAQNAMENSVDTTEIKEQYKKNVSEIMGKFFAIADENLTLEIVRETKEKMLSQKLTEEFKNLHLNLILALSKYENYMISKNEGDKISAQRMLNEAKANHIWLNNR